MRPDLQTQDATSFAEITDTKHRCDAIRAKADGDDEWEEDVDEESDDDLDDDDLDEYDEYDDVEEEEEGAHERRKYKDHDEEEP